MSQSWWTTKTVYWHINNLKFGYEWQKISHSRDELTAEFRMMQDAINGITRHISLFQ